MSIIRRLFSVLLMLILCLALTACGSGIEGAWKLSGGNAIGAIYSLSSSADLESAGAEAVFRFKDDGVLAIDMSRDGMASTSAGTWKIDGDALTIMLNGASVSCTYSIEKDALTIFFTIDGQNAAFTFNRI